MPYKVIYPDKYPNLKLYNDNKSKVPQVVLNSPMRERYTLRFRKFKQEIISKQSVFKYDEVVGLLIESLYLKNDLMNGRSSD
jgi:hypothetical protein